MKTEAIEILGLPLERWTHESCIADFAIGLDWATLYTIASSERRKGHATELLVAAKEHYEKEGKIFGGSVALNGDMRRIYQRLGIKEYDDPSDLETALMRVFDFIKRSIAETGCSPSYDQIARELGLKSKTGVSRMVEALEGRGFIRRRPNSLRASHNIEVLRDDLGIDARLEALRTWFKNMRPTESLSADSAIDVLLKIARSR